MCSARAKTSTTDKARRFLSSGDDDSNYLSKETISRREDQKLINNITSALYRLELENIKPSFDVKLKAGLHRGPFKSKRTRRSHVGSSLEEFDDYGRPISYSFVDDDSSAGEQPFQRTKLPAVRYDDDDVDALSAKVRSWGAVGGEQWLSSVDNYRRTRNSDDTSFYQSPIERYTTLPSRWLRELDKIDEDGRRRAAVTIADGRRKDVSEEYSDLMRHLAREDATVTTRRAAASGSRTFFDDNRRTPVDDSDEIVEQLFDRPFGRRGASEDGGWRTLRT